LFVVPVSSLTGFPSEVPMTLCGNFLVTAKVLAGECKSKPDVTPFKPLA
jgi:hypothetical protein